MTVADLKGLAKDVALSASGLRKADLVARLAEIGGAS
eukprot:CAMPEP_0198421726 /NCGR_PEP_ID=MMETSP1452-20131203/1859_1 /TAXON_ID=1181717 /ORGANISM="Synchroma pusillum, Strain CCMP3072" /LENGTH=36 /DNA_ID= /DNA_START= /DNA_END= /DNA_ORIENTATION=